jgi:lysophospholipase L1-like esterase
VHSRFWRRLAFRLAAVIVGLMPFVLAEVTLRLFDVGRPDSSDDPFVGFRSVHPLFVLGEDGTRYEIARSRQGFFRPDSFARHKAPNEFRIFCLGGSTVQGRPFAIETSFTTWLEISLEAAERDRRWEVVNCGGISYASYRLVPILQEVLSYEPDLIVLYTGHNEFLEDRTYGQVKYMPEIIAYPWELLLRTRTYNVLRQGYVRLRGPSGDVPREDRPILASEADAILEYRGGLEQYHRDEKWRRDVIEHFRYNLRRMVQITQDAHVPILLVNPVCNLRDCLPFKTQHRHGLAAEELARWESLVTEAGKCQGTDMVRAVALLKQAMAIDDQHAGLHYLLAKCYDAMGMTEEAHRSYLQAKELDICPLRILEPMNQAILDVARQTDTPLVDVRKMYEELSGDGIPGSYLLVDHVHPSIPGHQLIANALADELVRQGKVHPRPEWREVRDRKYAEHFDSLDDFYFAKGQERLERLRCWTQGKADRWREDSPTTDKRSD